MLSRIEGDEGAGLGFHDMKRETGNLGETRWAQSVSKTPSSPVRTKPSLTPRITAPLTYLDLNGFRFRLLGFREMHLEHAVFEVGRHLAPIRILRKRETAHETPVGAFNP